MKIDDAGLWFMVELWKDGCDGTENYCDLKTPRQTVFDVSNVKALRLVITQEEKKPYRLTWYLATESF